MAPHTRAKRRPNIASTAASNDVYPSSNGDNLNGNHEPKSLGHETGDPKSQETEIPAPYLIPVEEGEQMLVPQTYDPDTYDLDGRMPWTPEPEPYDPETYAAWGRKRFGEEWYELRKTMLEERNIYLQYDGVYKERQKALRIMEHEVERRPFEPGQRAGRMRDAGWKRLWSRLSKELGITSNSASPTPSKDNDDSDTDLSGYNTYAPTPEPREPTPLPDDPWERLEYDRRRFHWDEERYHFERVFLKEALIDGARTRREDEDGDRQACEKREVMESFRYVDPSRFSLEQRHFQDHIDLPKKGWTREEIVAKYEADVALHEWRKNNPSPKRSGGFGEAETPEEKAASASWRQEFDNAWVRFYGSHTPKLPEHTEDYGVTELWRKGTHARVSRQQQREALLSDATGDASSLPQPPATAPRPAKDTSHKTRSGRISKQAPTHEKASPSDRRCRAPERDMPEGLRDNTRTAPQRQRRQRKTYEKERSSRRQAGKAPEYGMLGGGETRPSIRQPSNTRRTSSSGPRSGRLSKKPTAARNVKPQGIVKSRQTGPGRPKRPAKGSKG
ncbi:hypothetical protein GQ53DRAFT_651494 [Thozetella sp. PMI_491]|nr:hypothetical protein GQ53DRAFT_651494 [Thozetella sp. PMI_491]